MNIPLRNLSLLILIALFFIEPAPIFSEEAMTIAVLDIDPHKGMDKGYAGVISDRVRYVISKTGKFRLTSRRAMEKILEEQDFQQSGRCDDLACIVEVGKILSVQKMVAGRVGKIGDIYQISLQLIDVESAAIEKEVLDSCECDEKGLLKMAEKEACLLVGVEPSFFAESPADYSRHFDGDNGFSICLPDTWEKKKGMKGIAIFASSPPRKDAVASFPSTVTIVVEELPKAVSPEKYSKLSISGMCDVLTDFHQHEKGKLAVGNEEAERIIYSYKVGTGEVKVLQYTLVRDRRAYILTCSAAANDFPLYWSGFEKIAQSFRFE